MASGVKLGDDFRTKRPGGSVISAIRHYVHTAITVPSQEGKVGKVLILDPDTTQFVSMVISQTEIVNLAVFYVEQLGSQLADEKPARVLPNGALQSANGNPGTQPTPANHLNAIFIVRPSEENRVKLLEYLRKPRYSELHLFFTNIVPEGYLAALAEADRYEYIRSVKEFYCDYIPINDDLFTLSLPRSLDLSREKHVWTDRHRNIFNRQCDGLASVLLSMKKRPIVRYAKTSSICKEIAFQITRLISQEAQLFSFRQTETDPVLLVLDRRDDPVTPLLSQWTYQAMVHELLEVHNGRVDMSRVRGIRKEMKEVVLSSHDDEFYDQSKFLNFGELGVKIKELVEKYQKRTNSNSDISSIEDMQRFVDNYPEFLKQSSHVSKHVAVMSEMSHLVEQHHLMDVSVVEQDLACEENHAKAIEQVREMLRSPRIHINDKLRLVVLYALRYETHSREINEFKALLRHKFDSPSRVSVVDYVLEHAGSEKRHGDLFHNKNLFQSTFNQVKKGLKGVENIYTQHTPYLGTILDKLLKGRLNAQEYPAADGRAPKQIPQSVFVYIAGGVTFEEAALVSSLNKQNSGVKIILGGPTIHNSTTFLRDLSTLFEGQIEVNLDLK